MWARITDVMTSEVGTLLNYCSGWLSIDYCYTIIDVFEEPGIILNFILLFGFPRVSLCVEGSTGTAAPTAHS
jgi:hypothetical protein